MDYDPEEEEGGPGCDHRRDRRKKRKEAKNRSQTLRLYRNYDDKKDTKEDWARNDLAQAMTAGATAAGLRVTVRSRRPGF